MLQNMSGGSSGHTRRREEFKVVIVGDGGCGKTSLLQVCTKGDFPEVRQLTKPAHQLAASLLYLHFSGKRQSIYIIYSGTIITLHVDKLL
jgi:GTPase SAR1 family protein